MLAVLVVVVGLFLGFASYVERTTTARLSGDVVAQYLLSTAANLAERLDAQLVERIRDAEDLASNALIGWFLAGDQEGDDLFEGYVQGSFDQLVRRSGVYDLMLAVDAEGQFQTSNSMDGQGLLLPSSVLETLRGYEFKREPWFQEAMERGFSLVDQHRSPLLPGPAQSGSPTHGPAQPSDFHILLASRVGSSEAHEEPVGVVCLLMNWKHVQEEVSSYGVRQLLAEDGSPGTESGTGQLMAEDIYQSSYAWVWKSDADTILAHPMHELYGQRVSQAPIELPHMVAAARSGRFGMYPDYSFRGVPKRAAFKHCRSGEEGGLGWVVGVGVDLDDIVAPVRNQSRVLYSATAVALSIAILLTVVIARRTTRPILELRRHTERVAHGDLDARVAVRGDDELADLGRAFNEMTAELKESRAQLVRVEKDAAWREMARQVAHEIKNPLTPISLSVSLLRRAVREESPEQGAILERTLDLVERQVEQMRGIAKDFYAFAGEDKEPRPLRCFRHPFRGSGVERGLGRSAGRAGRSPERGGDPARQPRRISARAHQPGLQCHGVDGRGRHAGCPAGEA